MDHGLDLGVPHHLELQLQERPEQRQQNQDEDCFHSEGDDNFKVHKTSTQAQAVATSWTSLLAAS